MDDNTVYMAGIVDNNISNRIIPWEYLDWKMLIRYNDREKAKLHVEAAKFYCTSEYVKFSKVNRSNLFSYVRCLGYTDYQSKLNKEKETDSSALQYLCFRLAGASSVRDWDKDKMLIRFPMIGDYFTTYIEDKYLKSPNNLMMGDVLISDSGVYCILNDSPKASDVKEIAELKEEDEEIKLSTDSGFINQIHKLAPPKAKNRLLAGRYTVTEEAEFRFGPNASEYGLIRLIKKGEAVLNYAYYTGGWLCVKDSKGNKGYIHKSHLKKK